MGFRQPACDRCFVSYGDKNIRLYNIMCENYRSPLQKSPNYRSLLQKSPNYRSLLQKSPIGLYCTRALSNSRQYNIVCVWHGPIWWCGMTHSHTCNVTHVCVLQVCVTKMLDGTILCVTSANRGVLKGRREPHVCVLQKKNVCVARRPI